jgi:xanthine dehydrogenase accessory factor
MGRLLDHRIVIIDDRPEYASVDRFTDADEVIALPFAEAIRGIEINGETLAILVTRGHRHDELCLRELLRTDVAYIGMLGSRRRVKAIFDDLHAEGYEPEQLSRVWAPVGLDIGAASPAEIAISILAEVVAWENGSTGPHPHLRRGPAGR